MLINLLGLHLKGSGFMWEPHPKNYSRSPQTGKDSVLNRALLWFHRFSYLPKQFLKQLWNLQDWISDSGKVECGSGGYSCLSLDEILILMYGYIFAEEWFPLFPLSDLAQHSYSSIQSSALSVMRSNPFAKINTILGITLVITNLAMKKSFLIWTRTKSIPRPHYLKEVFQEKQNFIFTSSKTGPKIP